MINEECNEKEELRKLRINEIYENDMECFICSEYMKKNNKIIEKNKPIECPNFDCSYIVCINCAKKYIMSQSEPYCMNCKVKWTQKFFYSNFNKSWIEGTKEDKYKFNHKNNILEKES